MVRVESVIPRRNVRQEVAGLLAIVLQGLANAACVRILLQSATYALSFYGPKIILDRPNNFGQVPIIAQFVLVGFKSFCTGPIYKN